MAHQATRLPMSSVKCKEDRNVDIGLFYLAVLYRFILLLLVQTSFVPDEIFQFVEPAYAMATGGAPSVRYTMFSLLSILLLDHGNWQQYS
jgi:hypothetical protein